MTIKAKLTPNGLGELDTYGSSNPYITAPHLQQLTSKLIDVAEGRTKRLAVFMPPRHGKSELISKYFPAWYLGNHPDKRIILCGYEADFAASWGAKVRNLLQEYHYIYGTTVDDKSAARNRWDITGNTGGMVTAGVGGPITGKGASILIIDDPVKNAEQANSETYREKTKDWYNSTAYTRLEPNGSVILIQTRWHEDDLGGWLLEDSNEDWDVLCLPAINDNGEPLWPDRFSLDKLLQIKKQVGEYWFSAMYQQQPQPLEGGILKRSWLQYYDVGTEYQLDMTKYTGWDLAISEKETADYTCSCTVGVRPNGDIYILDWTRDHIDFPSQQRLVPSIQSKYEASLIGIEDNQYQAALPQSLRHLMLPIKSIRAVRDKVTKIQSTFTLFEQGMIYLPNQHPLLGEWENEYAMFPSGKHDDLLDATEMALQLVQMGHNPYTDSDASYDFSKRRRESERRSRR